MRGRAKAIAGVVAALLTLPAAAQLAAAGADPAPSGVPRDYLCVHTAVEAVPDVCVGRIFRR